jgi:hypothetical protein
MVDIHTKRQQSGTYGVHIPGADDNGEISSDDRTVSFEAMKNDKAILFTAAADLCPKRYPLECLFRRFPVREEIRKLKLRPGQVAALKLTPSEGDLTLLVPIVKRRNEDPVRPHTWLKCILELRYWIEKLKVDSVYFITLMENADRYTDPDAWSVLVQALKDTDVYLRYASMMSKTE